MATIRKLKRKKGEAYQLNYADPTTGKRYRKTIYCDHKTAVAIRKDIEARLARKEYGIGSLKDKHVLWENIANEYLLKSDKTKAPETTKREKLVVNAFGAFVGNPDIRGIKVSKIEDYIHHRLKRDKVSPATVGIEIRVLRAIFYQAIRWKYISENPVVGVRVPNHQTVKVRYLRIDEVEKLLNVIPIGNFKSLIVAYLNTGARRNELLPPSFKWDNINLKEKRIYLHGKGDKERYVPINNSLYTILESLKKEGTEVPFHFKPDFVSHKISYYYKEAGINGANLHSLRKTFGSLLIQSGKADLYTVSKLLGHSSIRTTEKYYVDLLDENYHQSVRLLDDILPTISYRENA